MINFYFSLEEESAQLTNFLFLLHNGKNFKEFTNVISVKNTSLNQEI